VSVRRPGLALVLVFRLLPARADSPVVVVESAFTWRDDATLECRVSDGPLAGLLQFREDLADPSRREVTFGLSSPRFLMGPLAPTGLFREAANPFGFTPASPVFLERTGFQLDTALPSGDPGIVCMPMADILGLYCRSRGDSTPEYGCFASLLSESGCGGEGFRSLSSPPPGDFGPEWFRAQQPFPGGLLLSSAGRLLAAVPWLSMEAAAAASFGERVKPGVAWHLQASARADHAQAAFLFSRVEGPFVAPGGASPTADCQFACSAGVTPPHGFAKVAYTITVERAGFAPRPFRRTTEEITVALERSLLRAGGLQLVARVGALKRIHGDEYGYREESTSSRISFRGRARLLEAMAGAEVAEGEGLTLFFSALLPRAGRLPRISLDARLDRLDSALAELSARAAVTLESERAALVIQPGIDHTPLGGTATPWTDHLTVKVTFTTRVGGDH
jgi:hypothetical protein